MKRIFLVVAAVGLFWASVVRGATPLGLEPGVTLPPLSNASVEHDQWLKRVMLTAYDEVGSHDPKWDDLARRTLELSVDMWGPPRTRGRGNVAQYEAAQKAISAGCDDPMVLYVYGRTFLTFGGDDAKCIDIHRRAADGLFKSKYTAYYKALSQLRLAELLKKCGAAKEEQARGCV